jgi:hypothetical protein
MAIHTAASASYSDVNTAYGLCSAGDILSIPSGSETWSTQLVVTIGIYIVGAGIGSTVIKNGIGGGDALISYNPADYTLNSPFRLTGFTFDANANRILSLGASNKVAPFTLQTGIRIDHNKFTNTGGGSTLKGQAIYNYGTLYGVVDNNTIETFGYPIAHAEGSAREDWWDNSPQNIFVHGSAYYMYFEDNSITLGQYDSEDNNVLTDGQDAARYVFRYNTISNTYHTYSMFDLHGQQGEGYPCMPACFGAEIYGNQITHGDRVLVVMKQRAGQSLVFLNNATGTGSVGNEGYVSSVCTCPVFYPALKLTHNCYWWGSRNNLTGALWDASVDNTYGLDCYSLEDVPTLGRDIFSDTSTPGVSAGPLASIPGTCSVGQGYWATDQSISNLTGMVGVNPGSPIVGVLYRCLSTNVWTAYYSPYTYPHPLRGEGTSSYIRIY